MNKLMFGYDVPDDAEVAWGARFIVAADGYVDLPPDRHSTIEDGDITEFLARLTESISLRELKARISQKLIDGEINTRVDDEIILHDADGIRIVGNSRASAGYFYISAYPVAEVTA